MRRCPVEGVSDGGDGAWCGAFAVFASARYLTPKVRTFIDLAVAQMGDASM